MTGTRREKADRRETARWWASLSRAAERNAPVPSLGPGGRPLIPDSEVLGAPILVHLKCEPCGSPLRRVRLMDGGRFVFGFPWVELDPHGHEVLQTRCSGCGHRGSVTEQVLVRTARKAQVSGEVVPIAVGRRLLR